MLKKHLIFTVMLMVMAAFSANASTWKMHSYYVQSKIQNIFDAGDKVYYMNSNTLFRYDKATGVNEALNKQNLLSDNRITQIYYDWENRLLFVAYTSSNIDVIDSVGKVTNIPNLKNMVAEVHNYTLSNGELTGFTSKNIKDITFTNGVAYVTYGYGYLTIDESTLKVTKNYDLGQSIEINSVCRMGDTMIILSNNRCYWGAPGETNPIKNYQNVTGSYAGRKTYPINDHSVFVYSTAAGVYRSDFSTGSPVLTRVTPEGMLYASGVQKSATGFYANFAGHTMCYSIDPEGITATRVSSVIACYSSDPLGDGTVWITDANGLHTQGSSDYHKINSLTTDAPYWLCYNGVLNKLYVGVTGPNKIYNTSGTTVANVINTYDGVNWANATAYSASGAGYEFKFNPIDPHMYVRAGWSTGIHKVVDDVRKTNYTSSNSLISNYKPTPAFDNYGNLWVVSAYNAANNPCVVLPKDKVFNASVSKTDWFQPTGFLGLNTNDIQRSHFIVAKKNNMKIYTDGGFPSGSYNGHIVCFDNGSEDPTIDNYQMSSILYFVDQDNKQIKWTYIHMLQEDMDGNIWVGYDQGLFMFNPDSVFNAMPRAIHPFAKKFSEGSGYLCDSYNVYDIGVDRNNNKWIASDNGLYYVSPDASEVFNHFTIENSDIPSNTVYSVECDTVNDRAYIFTDNGFAEYIEEGDAAALNFDNMYAFPNPVEPDFTGMIKIANLMENSYVTVTDRNGNIVAQFGPVIGAAFWDGSGADGERLPTGIYNIYAAQGGQPDITATPQATVMIIK